MFTNQQNVTRSPLSITPRNDGNTARPPLGLLNDEGGGDSNDLVRFREAGLLDEESVMRRKDHEALVEKAKLLEQELYDYQYNMGLLLIENKELTANNEELREALSVTQETVKREQAAHFMAVSEVEKRADNLRKAVDFEKHCRAGLEKSLREIDEENKQVQLRSQAKLADARTLVARIGDKAREVEEKMLQADAKLAEVNRKSLEFEKKKQDLQSNESALQNERRSFIERRDAWEDTYSRHKEDLREWERMLHEGEERLCEGRKIINSREEKVNEIERSVKQKEKELDEAHNKIESSILESKRKEDDINKKLLDLSAREEQAETIKKNLEKKEKELLDLAKKLPAKERVELQKLKELEIETKSKELKEKEKSYKRAVDSFEADKDQLLAEMEILEALKSKIEKKRTEITSKELHVKEEIKRLKVTEDERATFSRLQSKLKDEIEACRLEKELIVRERNDLRNDVVKFEVEWEALDEKRSVIAKQFNEQKENWERVQETKLGKLENEKLHIKRELEAVKLEREISAATIKHEESLLVAKYHNEHRNLLHELEQRKRDLEADFQNKQTKMETDMQEKNRAFKEMREEEINNINYLKEVIRKDLEEVKAERERIAEEKDKFGKEKTQMEENQLGILQDISVLDALRKKITEKREGLVSERSRFHPLFENLKNCGNCGEIVRNYERSELHLAEVIRDHFPLPRTRSEINEKSEGILGNTLKSPDTGRLVSYLKRCASVFKSPQERIEHEHDDIPETPLPETTTDLDRKIETSNVQASLDGNKVAQKEPSETINDSLEQSYIGSKNLEAPEDSQQLELKSGRQIPTVKKPKGGPRKSRSDKALPADDASIEIISEDKIDDSVNANDVNPQASSYVSTRGPPTTRKGAHTETSLVSGSEMDGGDTVAHSGSVTTVVGGRRKRQQTVASTAQTPGRYNLRRHKTEDAAPQAKPSVNNRKKDVSGTQKGETAAAVDTDVVSQKGETQIVDTA